MQTTTLYTHSRFVIDHVDPRIFGGFLEHMGRAIYQGVYDPSSLHSDESGFRRDVMAALRRQNMTVMRYPGGNFASGYHWIDGIGEKRIRPTVRELAWQSIEPNTFGTDEFIHLCQKLDWQPMLTVNLGTGTPEEARNWVEYCNACPGTKYADLRGGAASKTPHGVKLWCLGNEMDGPWQLGHVPADQYAIRAQQAAKMMKDVDNNIQLVACGTCSVRLSSYMEWDRQVLEHLGDYADYISLHRYVGNHTDNTLDYLAISKAVDRQIEEMDAVCRYVQAKRKSRKRTYLCFDEWNVWYKNKETDGGSKFAPHLIEEVYNLEDALVVAGFLNSFIRHADSVKIANIAQIVNVIAPLLTRGDDLLIQSIFYPFEMISRFHNGISLQIVTDGPSYDSLSYGKIDYLDSSAILDGHNLNIFVVNRSIEQPVPLRFCIEDSSIRSFSGGLILSGGADPKAENSFDHPNTVVAKPFEDVKIVAGNAHSLLPPLTYTVLSFTLD